MTFRTCLHAVLLLAIFAIAPAWAQDAPIDQQLPPRAAPTSHVQVNQLPLMDATPQFDVDKATNAYLARVNGPARARSDAYTEGGYGLMVVDLLYGLAVAGLLLWLQISSRIRDWVEERTRSRTLQTLLYVAIYLLLVTAAEFPLAVYEGFFREHAYGLSNQDFWQWFGDFAIGFGVSLAGSLIGLPIFYAAVRAARENWWLWGALIAIVFLILANVIYPVAIAPLTNHYAPLPDSPLKQDILSLARANLVPADNVYVYDASRQTNEISANVAGFLGTARIALNDNLLRQGSHDEIMAVLGHEIGHYVMGHVLRTILLLGLVIVVGFAFLSFSFRLATGLFGGNWQVRQVDDIAGLPLLAALMSIYMFVAMPVVNTVVRSAESQADLFGVNAVRKPDAFATTVLKLSSYRKLDPGPWEEALFYDHPSGRSRIHMMMVWKKEHLRDPDIRDMLAGNPR